MRLTRARVRLFLALGCALWLGPAAYASAASDLYQKGLQAEGAGRIAEAYRYFMQAATVDPKKKMYRERAVALAPLAAVDVNLKAPFAIPDDPNRKKEVVKEKPPLGIDDVYDSISARDLAAQRELLEPARLAPKPGLQDYDIQGDAKTVFEQVGARLGLRVLFDADFHAGRPIHLRLAQVEPREALHDAEAATGTFVTTLSATTFLVAQDTEAKRKELEQVEVAAVTIPTAITVQEITELGQAVKQAVGIDKIFWDTQTNQIVLRDTVTKVLAAESVLQDLTRYKTEVAVDLEFIELDDTQALEVGVDLQTSFPITFISQVLSGTATASSTLSTVTTLAQLAKFGVGSLFGLGIADANVVATMTKAGAKTLLHATVVSTDGQKATFHAGEKYPVVSGAFVGGVATGGSITTPAPTITFEDLGIVLTVTPRVNDNSEVTMDVDTEYKLLGANSVNGIPVISGRKLQSTVRMKSGQWALVAGLTSETNARSVSGPAFLSYIPYLGHLISHFTGNKAKTYVIVAMKPRVLSVPPSQRVTHTVWVGSSTRDVTPL